MNLYLFNEKDVAATYGIGSYLNVLTLALEEDTDINVHMIHLYSDRPEFEIVNSLSLANQNKVTNYVENWYIPAVQNKSVFSGTVQELADYYKNVIYLLRLHINDTTGLVFHFNYNQSYFLAKGLKSVFDCKTVATVHFIKWMLEFQGNLSRWHILKSKPENQRTPFEQLLFTTDEYEGLLYKEVDKVITLSLHSQNLLCNEHHLNPEKVFVIPNGLEDSHPLFETERMELRKKWHIPQKEFVVLFVGRLHAAKGLLFLIKAFRRVLEQKPDCRLMIAGNGNLESFRRMIDPSSTKITFTGLVEKQAVHELYRLADIGVLPSLTEQCSYVVMEMMMNSLPIITTSAPGLAEMTENEVSSLQTPLIEQPDRIEIDTDLLAEKILYLSRYPDEAKRLGENARKRYEENYSIAAFRKNMQDFFQIIMCY